MDATFFIEPIANKAIRVIFLEYPAKICCSKFLYLNPAWIANLVAHGLGTQTNCKVWGLNPGKGENRLRDQKLYVPIRIPINTALAMTIEHRCRDSGNNLRSPDIASYTCVPGSISTCSSDIRDPHIKK